MMDGYRIVHVAEGNRAADGTEPTRDGSALLKRS
jgi:hypothetical protein